MYICIIKSSRWNTNLLKPVQIPLTTCENKGMTLALDVKEKSDRRTPLSVQDEVRPLTPRCDPSPAELSRSSSRSPSHCWGSPPVASCAPPLSASGARLQARDGPRHSCFCCAVCSTGLRTDCPACSAEPHDCRAPAPSPASWAQREISHHTTPSSSLLQRGHTSSSTSDTGFSDKRDPGAQNQSLGYICSNSQKYIVCVKIIDFSFMPKIIKILSKDHVPWRYFVHFLPYWYQNLIFD